VQSHDRSVEVFRIRTEEEARKKQARRRKRAKEKKEKAKGTQDSVADADDTEDAEKPLELVDLFTPHLVVRASGKVRSFDFSVVEASKGGLPVR
jgi:U3 small nucleolar RNA-associated protein 12